MNFLVLSNNFKDTVQFQTLVSELLPEVRFYVADKERYDYDIYQEKSPDILLVDISENYLNGSEVISKIQEFRKKKLLLAALMPEKTSDSLWELITKLDFDLLFYRPINKHQIKHQIKIASLILSQLNLENTPSKTGRLILPLIDGENELKCLSKSYAAHSGKGFFEAISEHIAIEMELDSVFVGKWQEETASVKVIGGYDLGKPIGELVYELKGTPCYQVLNKNLCVYEEGVQKKFPNDKLLIELEIEGYIGSPILDRDNQSIGVLVGLKKAPIKNGNLILKFLGLYVDIISAEILRNKIEKELRKSLLELNQAQKVAKVGSWYWDIEKDKLEWSNEMFEIYGIPKTVDDKIIAVKELIYPEDIPILDSAMEKIFNIDVPPSIEYRIKRKDGKTVYIGANLEKIKDAKGKVTLLLGTAQDVTTHKMAAIELTKAKDKAEESERLKTAFLANMSHEIRTPMNGILGFLELLKSEKISSEEQKRYIDIVKRSGERLLVTINDIIEISKIEAGEIHILKCEFNLHKVLTYLFNFFLPQTQKIGIELVLNIEDPSKPLYINSDKNKLESILINLLKNAIKFTTIGKIEFGYQIHNQHLKFYVKDTGVGISSDRHNAIFDRFVQADLKVTRGHEGSGLGLSISKAYTNMLGGEVWAESGVGVGSTFYFTIEHEAVDKLKVTDVEPNEPKLKKNQKEIAVLVAEDDDTSFILIEKMLSSFNVKLVRAFNGKEVLEKFTQIPNLSLILMDMKMPIMDGAEATRRIRKENTQIPIIAQTAFSDDDNKQKALNAGCNDYISKPILGNALIEKIIPYLDN